MISDASFTLAATLMALFSFSYFLQGAGRLALYADAAVADSSMPSPNYNVIFAFSFLGTCIGIASLLFALFHALYRRLPSLLGVRLLVLLQNLIVIPTWIVFTIYMPAWCEVEMGPLWGFSAHDSRVVSAFGILMVSAYCFFTPGAFIHFSMRLENFSRNQKTTRTQYRLIYLLYILIFGGASICLIVIGSFVCGEYGCAENLLPQPRDNVPAIQPGMLTIAYGGLTVAQGVLMLFVALVGLVFLAKPSKPLAHALVLLMTLNGLFQIASLAIYPHHLVVLPSGVRPKEVMMAMMSGQTPAQPFPVEEDMSMPLGQAAMEWTLMTFAAHFMPSYLAIMIVNCEKYSRSDGETEMK